MSEDARSFVLVRRDALTAPPVRVHSRRPPFPGRGTVFLPPRLDLPVLVHPGRPRGPVTRGVRRAALTDPVAPSQQVDDATVFASPAGDATWALPRYALALDGPEPRIAVVERDGTPTLVLTLVEAPGPAAGPGVGELPHALAVTLKLSLPVLEGGTVVQELPFPVVTLDEAQTTVTAELPLSTPGLREQLVAATASLAASVTVVVGRGITVAVPTGEHFPDTGEPAYVVRQVLLDRAVPPTPLVLSDAHRARLGGGDQGLQPVLRVRVPFGGRTHSYFQDPSRPERFACVPDRFLLARAATGPLRAPALRVRAVEAAGAADVSVLLEFSALPVTDPRRLAAAVPQLEQEARARGTDAPVRLEVLSVAQPLLRLALPRPGGAASVLVEREDADLDLERGLVHAETFRRADFLPVYDALFGASLSLLRGEVRVLADSATPEDIPLELRLDRTVGDVVELVVEDVTGERVTARLTNVVESPVVVGAAAVAAVVEGRQVPLTVEGPEAPRLGPGESWPLVLVAPGPLPPDVVLVLTDPSSVVVEPDRDAVWSAVFDAEAGAQLTRTLVAQAVPEMFVSPDRPDDRVALFVITVEDGGSVTLTATALTGETTVQVPVQPLITGAPVPPTRYRTETAWTSGGIGVSAWRETPGTVLLPVKTPPG